MVRDVVFFCSGQPPEGDNRSRAFFIKTEEDLSNYRNYDRMCMLHVVLKQSGDLL